MWGGWWPAKNSFQDPPVSDLPRNGFPARLNEWPPPLSYPCLRTKFTNSIKELAKLTAWHIIEHILCAPISCKLKWKCTFVHHPPLHLVGCTPSYPLPKTIWKCQALRAQYLSIRLSACDSVQHKNAKIQKHKNTKTQKHKTTTPRTTTTSARLYGLKTFSCASPHVYKL